MQLQNVEEVHFRSKLLKRKLVALKSLNPLPVALSSLATIAETTKEWGSEIFNISVIVALFSFEAASQVFPCSFVVSMLLLWIHSVLFCGRVNLAYDLLAESKLLITAQALVDHQPDQADKAANQTHE